MKKHKTNENLNKYQMSMKDKKKKKLEFSRSTVWDSRFIEPTKSVEEIHNPLAADDERRFLSRVHPAEPLSCRCGGSLKPQRTRKNKEDCMTNSDKKL
ncbi:hypothetical protein MAR_028136 [Mya arenaria]|uniref:Uncharacterized protein n=1 Tax=Mya arenaria TaxID=6604 RepID=A0ABY7DCQ7_MYAAR|nr:hypothetical protein MAR_028136 [Mya arenaria]